LIRTLRLLGASTLPFVFVTVAVLAACGNSEDTESETPDASTDASSTKPTSSADAATTTGTDAAPITTDAAPSSGDAATHPDGAATDSGADSGETDSGTGNTVVGVSGTTTTFTSKDAVSGNTTDGDDSFFEGTSTTLFITSFTGACADLAANTQAPSTGNIFVQLAADVQSDDQGFTGGPVTGPATFTFVDIPDDGTNAAMGEIDGFDAMCGFLTDPLQSGTITVTAVTMTGIEGTIEATSEAGVVLSGHFSTSTCSSVVNIGGDSIMCQTP
jgi:hypothetical protein